jgi:hypothetical protein
MERLPVSVLFHFPSYETFYSAMSHPKEITPTDQKMNKVGKVVPVLN